MANRVFSTTERILEKINLASIKVASGAVILMFVLVMTEIIARKIFKFSIHISIEYTEYALAVVIMYASGDLLKKRSHLAVQVLTDKLPLKMRRGMELVFYLLSFLVYVVMVTWLCYRLVAESFSMDVRSFSITRTPLWIPQAVMLAGLFVLCAILIFEIIVWFVSKPDK